MGGGEGRRLRVSVQIVEIGPSASPGPGAPLGWGPGARRGPETTDEIGEGMPTCVAPPGRKFPNSELIWALRI